MTIRRLLVANRGEIARRVFRTCRALGIETVAVFSDADAGLPFVREADVSVRLPGSTPAETYLRGDLVVEAARQAGADAVHPGYGFLSENATFARQVIEAGLTWVGPAPESIEAMGSKVEAKKLMEQAGVPVLGEISPASVTEADLPLLVKASAGGGGRGMRVVRTLADVAPQVELASNEAASAFGDPTVFCEPYVEHGRHVEVQVVGDTHGTVLVLGERDCSIQRRHQKVVEETPAPGLSDETRTALHEAARQAAEAIDYVGAGTVEFLLSGDRFWFLEMNTRLQVEHPVTELVTGLDLVAMQIAVAEGRRLALTGAGGAVPEPRGHAVEVRLYAEDPANDWQPQSGRLTRFDVPEVAATFENPTTYGIRLDSGFEAGSEVGTHYDAMLAKVVAWGPTRDEALRRLAGTLARARIHGLRTNRDLLVEVLRHDAVVEGDVSTDFFDRHEVQELAGREYGWGAVIPSEVSAHAAALALAEHDVARRRVQRRVPVAWRNVPSQPQVTRFVVGHRDGSRAVADDDVREVEWYAGRQGYRFASQDEPALDATSIRAGSATTERVVLQVNGVDTAFEVSVRGDLVDVDSVHGHVALTRLPRFVDPADQVATGSLLSPMPGVVIDVAVAAGDHVAAGQTVLVLEAMKMQHTVSAPHDGVVVDLPVTRGDQVAAGAVLAVVQEDNETEQDVAAEGDSNE
ncbi:MAG TPA: biotin carboxylase N-terminal domain-containing protein [Nocardioidaceae bacterium]|nr:biotin carboxylase N-terminal domain-containing protein [Nocardioidaceae bacterium]